MEAKSKAAELQKTLERARGKRLIVLISGHPDPDAIASAFAHRRICEYLDVSATIAHVLPIARPDNRAMVKLLNIEMLRVSEPRELEGFDYLSLVDTHATEATIQIPERLTLLTVVDHHRPRVVPSADFIDIRPDIGAASSVYAEYMEHGLAPLTGGGRDDERVATALFLGIQTDTDDFALARSADFRSAAFLRPHADAELLSRIGRRAIAAEVMDAIGRALEGLVVVREFAVAGVGAIPARHRDAIPAAADFILRREDIDTAVVFGIVDGRIDGSLRTNSPSVDPAAFLEAAFGQDASGRPFGGGRANKGGFQIPIGVLADTRDANALLCMVTEFVFGRLRSVVPELNAPATRTRAQSGS